MARKYTADEVVAMFAEDAFGSDIDADSAPDSFSSGSEEDFEEGRDPCQDM